MKVNGKQWSTVVEQAVACAPVTQRVRVRSPVGTSFLGEVLFQGFSSSVRQMSGTLGPHGSRITFDHHNHPYHIRLVRMNEWMVCIVFNVRVVSEVASALS